MRVQFINRKKTASNSTSIFSVVELQRDLITIVTKQINIAT